MLVLVVLVPLVLGILQVALVMQVRNTLAAAASEGARVAATADRGPADGVAATREQIGDAIAGQVRRGRQRRSVSIDGAPGVRSSCGPRVPALGLGGPSIEVEVAGRAVEEPDR